MDEWCDRIAKKKRDFNLIYFQCEFIIYVNRFKIVSVRGAELCIHGVVRFSFNPHMGSAKVEDLLSHFALEMPQIIILITMRK